MDTTANVETATWESLRERSLQAGGFGEDRVRIWPALLGVQPLSDPPPYSEVEHAPQRLSDVTNGLGCYGYEDTDPHPDERQIKLDTDRSFVLYPLESSSTSRDVLQNGLHALLLSLFRKRRSLHYFQGFHDIISVLFLTLPKPLHFTCVEKMALHRVRDSMGVGLEPVVGLLRILRNLLRLVDPEYAELLESTSPLPYHALSNLLTLFSHDVPTLPLIQHVWDFLLSREPIAVVWLAAAVIIYRKPSIQLLVEQDEEGMIHSLLGSLPELIDGESQSLPDAPTIYGTSDNINGDAHFPVSKSRFPDGNGCAVISDDVGDLYQGNDSHQRTGALLARTDDVYLGMSCSPDSADPRIGTGAGISTGTEHDAHSSNVDEDLATDGNPDTTTCSTVSSRTELATNLDKPEGIEIPTYQEKMIWGKSNIFRSPTISPQVPSPSGDSISPTHQFIHNDLLPEASPRSPESATISGPACVDHHMSPILEPTEAQSRPPTPNNSVSRHSAPSHRSKLHRIKPLPLSLPDLLRQADGLLNTYPPSHPDLRVHEIMGKDSVVQTWHAPIISDARDMPMDKWESGDYLESLVNSEDIVISSPPPSPVLRPRLHDTKYSPSSNWNGKGLLSLRQVGLRLGLLTPSERRLVLAGALVVVIIAVALKYNKLPKGLEMCVFWKDQRRLVSMILTFWGRAPWS